MRRVEGSPDVRLLECTSPARNKWRVRWDVEAGEGGSATYMEEELGHKPTPEDIERILSGSGVDATDEELEAMGTLLGYDKAGFDAAFEGGRTARVTADPTAQLMEAMREQLSGKTDMADEQALETPAMFLTFSRLCKRGKEVKKGTVIRHANKLWRVIQNHTPMAIYPPSMDTASLYARIEPGHAGTQDDPIPYEQGMAFEKGKYYSQHGVTYLCVLTTVNGYPYDLKDLPTIVQPV